MKALVLCGGHGTRLGAVTRDLPKPLLPLGGRPLLGYTLPYLASFGFTEVAINLHAHADKIRDYCGDGSALGVRLHYHHEESLAGTAGTVRALSSFFGAEDFLVLYGDILTDQDLQALLAFHRASGAKASLLLHQRPDSNSLVDLDEAGRIRGFVERPSAAERRRFRFPWVNSGVQVLSPEVIDWIPEQVPCDLPRDVYTKVVRDGGLFGFPLSGYRCAIDSVERYEQAQRAVASGTYRLADPVVTVR